MSVMIHETPAPRPAWSHGLALLLVFVGTVFLFTRHNTFPYTYHPDEDTKVRQIVTGKRNFFHPLLMLTTTDLAMKIGRIEKTPMNAAIAGRTVSAAFTALAVCALGVLAWRWTGWLGGLVAAVLLTINPLVFELAHYFKEDPALLMGLAVAFLALDGFWKASDKKSAAFLGLGCALAISGKYLGAVMLLFALPPLIWRCREKGWSLAGWFAVGFFVPLLLINLPLFLNWNVFEKGLSREMAGATEGHRGLGREVPHAYYFGRMAELTPWGLWVGLIVAVGVIVWKRRLWTPTQWLTLAFPVFFFVLLSFSPKTAGRYLLPVEAFAAFLAAVGVFSLRLGFLRCLMGVIIALGSAQLFQTYHREFSSDARADLRLWVAEKTPPQAIIAEDGRVDLEADPTWKARPVLASEYAPDLGSLADLRAKGVTHVAVARQAYNRYFNESLRPSAQEKVEFERRAAFYRELFATGKLVWESPIGTVIYLHPGLRLYSIETPAPAATGH